MTNVAVIYYSATGNVYALAEAVAQGASKAGAEVRVRRAAELAPAEAVGLKPAWQAHLDATAGVAEATLDDLRWADGYASGTPTRYGNVSSQSSCDLGVSDGSLSGRTRRSTRALLARRRRCREDRSGSTTGRVRPRNTCPRGPRSEGEPGSRHARHRGHERLAEHDDEEVPNRSVRREMTSEWPLSTPGAASVSRGRPAPPRPTARIETDWGQ